MDRVVVVVLCGVLIACSVGQRTESPRPERTLRAQEAATLDDSIDLVVATYESGKVTLSEATRQLADLVEPLGGLAAQGKQSPRAEELFQSTGRELRRRDARKYGYPDSLVKE